MSKSNWDVSLSKHINCAQRLANRSRIDTPPVLERQDNFCFTATFGKNKHLTHSLITTPWCCHLVNTRHKSPFYSYVSLNTGTSFPINSTVVVPQMGNQSQGLHNFKMRKQMIILLALNRFWLDSEQVSEPVKCDIKAIYMSQKKCCMSTYAESRFLS